MQPTVNLDIADTRLCFHSRSGLRIQPPGWDYPDFIAPASAPGDAADINIVVSAGAPPAAAEMTACFDTGDAWRMSSSDHLRRIEMVPRDGTSAPHWCADTDCEYRQVQLYCADRLLQTGIQGTEVRHLVQYPLDQILLVQHLLGARKGLLLHAAGAVVDVQDSFQGVVFAGISGAGKSTLTRQFMDNPGWRFLSDDRIVLRLGPTAASMHGTPWPGDAHVALNRSAPLKALCFLRQADSSHLQPLSSAEALERLLPVTSIPWYDRPLLHNALDCCEQLLARVPAYVLNFRRRDPRLADIVKATLA